MCINATLYFSCRIFCCKIYSFVKIINSIVGVSIHMYIKSSMIPVNTLIVIFLNAQIFEISTVGLKTKLPNYVL